MLNKIMIAATVAIILGTAGAVAAQSHYYGNSYGSYADQYGLGYSSTARHDPRDTNGF